MIRVSVIIPTYNRAAYLAEAIDSALAQRIEDGVEVIVVDDGSTDETADMVRRFGDAIRYLPVPHLGLPAAARNHGLRVARGEFVALLDSDDLFLGDKLALQDRALASRPNVAVVYSDGVFFHGAVARPVGRVLDGLPRPSGDAFPDLLRGNFLFPAVTLIRRTHIEAVGGFDENPNLRGVEDYDMWLRLAARSPFLHLPGDVAAIRRHEGNVSRDVAAIRAGVLRVLGKMDATAPELMHRHRAARHEGYARSHGAVAAASFRQANFSAACVHGIAAGAHAACLPGAGMTTLAAWWQRRARRRWMQA